MGSGSWYLEVDDITAVVGVASCQQLLLWVGTKVLPWTFSVPVNGKFFLLTPTGHRVCVHCIWRSNVSMINLSLQNFDLSALVRVWTTQHRLHPGLHKLGGEFEYNLKFSPLWSLLLHHYFFHELTATIPVQIRCNHKWSDCGLFPVGPVRFLSLCYAVPSIFHHLLYKLWISY